MFTYNRRTWKRTWKRLKMEKFIIKFNEKELWIWINKGNEGLVN